MRLKGVPEFEDLLIQDDDQSDGIPQHSSTPISRLPPTILSDHCHIPKAGKQKSQKAITKLILASILTFMFMIGEVIGGYLAGSIAIMSDAAHMLSDLTSFVVSLIAIFLSMRPASSRMNFGFHRAEVLGAVMSVVIIWFVTGVLVYIAIQRVVTMKFEVVGDTMIIVAAVSVIFNIVLGIVLHFGEGHSHSHGSIGADSSPNSKESRNVNIRAAFIHVLGDLIQSIGVLVSAYIIRYFPEYKIADPICTFIFSIIVIVTTVPILKDLSMVLMEAAPAGVDYVDIVSSLAAIPGVKMVHSLHLWAITMDKNTCAVHLAIGPDVSYEATLSNAQNVLRNRYHIFHNTIQVERYDSQIMDNCQQCQPLQ